MGSLTGLLKKIQSAMKRINKKSCILRSMIKKGEITVSGGVYDVGTGVVNFLG